MNADHVQFDLGAKPPVLRCARCGAAHPVPLPIKLNDMTDVMDTFTAKHAKCSERDSE